MNIERERRWLVRREDIPAEVLAAPAEHITQGYLSPFKLLPVVRVRLLREAGATSPHRGVQTVKMPRSDGMAEVEFDIPLGKAEELMTLKLAGLEKVRYTYPLPGALAYEVTCSKASIWATCASWKSSCQPTRCRWISLPGLDRKSRVSASCPM